MAITREQKKLLGQKIIPYKDRIEELDAELKKLDSISKKNPGVKDYVEIKKASIIIQKCNILLSMSRLSYEIQNTKNDTFLNDARKQVSSTVNHLLKIVGEDIDSSFKESSEGAQKLNKLTPDVKLKIVRALRDCTQGLNDELGQNNKWRWSFPDIHYKIATFARNLFDFKEYDKSKDPSAEFYRERQEMLKFIIEQSQYAAQEFRSRYELSTNDVSDLHVIRRLLESMKQIFILTGNQTEIKKIKTAIDANEEKIESVSSKKDKKK